MKKVLSLFLAVLMVASIVAMMPVFTVSAAELDTSGLTKIEGTVGGNTGCGFIDGNATPTDTATYGMSVIMGTSNNTEVLSRIKVYVDGVEARFNKSYKGYTHGGRNGSDGIFYGVVGAGFTKDQESTLTFVIDDTYYMEGTFTPSVTAHTVSSSETVYYTGNRKIVSVVTFADASAFEIGDELTLRFHDDHSNTNTATVTAKDGNTVTIVTTNVTTNFTLCEYKLDDDSWFSVPIDEQAVTDGAYGYLQTRPNADETKFDTRVIVESLETLLANYNRIAMDLTFTMKDGKTSSYHVDSTTFYKEITAAGGNYTAGEGCAMYGCVVTGIPKGVDKVSAVVALHNDETSEQYTINVGSGNLNVTTDASVSDVRDLTKIPESDITATKFNGNTSFGDNEQNPNRLFDGNTRKFGTADATITVEFTLEKATAINGIIFSVGNDSRKYGRTFTSWTIEGKRDDGSWAVVAYSNNAITYGNAPVDGGYYQNNYDGDFDADTLADNQRQAFFVENTAAYKEYRLIANKNGGYSQMGEISLYTDALNTIKTTMDKYTDGITVTKYTGNNKDGATGSDIPSGNEQNPNNLFDNKTNKHGDHSDNPFIVEFNTQSAIAISAIIFSHANDSASSDRYYSSWKLEALDDKGTVDTSDDEWVTVYDCAGGMERPDQDYNTGNIPNPDDLPDSLRICYLIGDPTAYQYYRLTAAPNGTNYNQMGEITFYTEKAN